MENKNKKRALKIIPIEIPMPPVRGVGFEWNFLCLSGESINICLSVASFLKIAFETRDAKNSKRKV